MKLKLYIFVILLPAVMLAQPPVSWIISVSEKASEKDKTATLEVLKKWSGVSDLVESKSYTHQRYKEIEVASYGIWHDSQLKDNGKPLSQATVDKFLVTLENSNSVSITRSTDAVKIIESKGWTNNATSLTAIEVPK